MSEEGWRLMALHSYRTDSLYDTQPTVSQH